MGDIFGIIPDAEPPEGKKGMKQDMFGNWYNSSPPSNSRQKENSNNYSNSSSDDAKEYPNSLNNMIAELRNARKNPQDPSKPKERGYVATQYVETGKDIIKGIKFLVNYKKKKAEYQRVKNIMIFCENVKNKRDLKERVDEFKITQEF